MGDAEESTVIAVALARIEGKLDVLNTKVESLAQTGTDHETRLRLLETAGLVTRKAMWTGLAACATAAGSIAAILALFIGG